MNPLLRAVIVLVVAIGGIVFGYYYRKRIAEGKISNAEDAAKRIVEEAEKQAEATKREALLEAKEEIHKLRSDIDRESRERRNESQRIERRLQQKEENLDKKSESLDSREEAITRKQKQLQKTQGQIDMLYNKQLNELERISGFTIEQAKQHLIASVEKEITHEVAVKYREIDARYKEEAEKQARKTIALSIQKFAADHVAESTVSVVALPNDEMKGRIIGREGRNIRTLETATGIDLIIDDTPEAVILSGFDPIRREIARIALEKLIVDGRIHPARIEEMVEKARKEVDTQIRDVGEQAVFDIGLHGVHPEMVKLLGRLKYRTS
ncbi:MAG TPA: Rnase Y domain-containing protein, partial [Bacillota bacterium]|nr:Rnase Y domain-containing protein [Bacillota bacterium]